MKEKRNIQIDINTARNWYLSEDSFKQELALKAFSKEELEKAKLPTCTEEFYKNYEPKNNYLSKVRLLQTLLMIRDVYRQGWKPDWTNEEQLKWCIFYNIDIWKIDFWIDESKIFSFPTQELAEKFLENFKEELEQLKELL